MGYCVAKRSGLSPVFATQPVTEATPRAIALQNCPNKCALLQPNQSPKPLQGLLRCKTSRVIACLCNPTSPRSHSKGYCVAKLPGITHAFAPQPVPEAILWAIVLQNSPGYRLFLQPNQLQKPLQGLLRCKTSLVIACLCNPTCPRGHSMGYCVAKLPGITRVFATQSVPEATPEAITLQNCP